MLFIKLKNKERIERNTTQLFLNNDPWYYIKLALKFLNKEENSSIFMSLLIFEIVYIDDLFEFLEQKVKLRRYKALSFSTNEAQKFNAN